MPTNGPDTNIANLVAAIAASLAALAGRARAREAWPGMDGTFHLNTQTAPC
jgi:hypothetical protein